MGGLGFIDLVVTSSSEYKASIKVTNPLVRRIVKQEHQLGRHYIMALTKPLMPIWIFMLEVFGRDRDLHSSTFGCVTLMQTLTET